MTACVLSLDFRHLQLCDRARAAAARPSSRRSRATDTLIPSAVFFDYETKGRVLFGAEAIDTYVGQHDGRLMRALKSILGSPLIDEKTALGSKMVALTEVVEIFVRHLKSKAEAFAGEELTAVVHGRPVRFVENDDAADAKAERVLKGIANRVGFRDVAFVYEPIAAAYHYEETATGEETVLIADIGGGTSDFTVIRIGPERRALPDRTGDILSNAGVRIGGTDFDSLLSLNAVMPLLGLGTHLVREESADAKFALFRARDLADDQLHLHVSERARCCSNSSLARASRRRLRVC